MTHRTNGPSKLTRALPISAPYSNCRRRSDSGEPSKPERLASITTGRLPLAALIARATFFDDSGNSVPADHWVGPSAGVTPWRGSGRDSIPRTVTAVSAEPRLAHHGRLGFGHLRPPLEDVVVGVDDGGDDRADVERLLAVAIRRLGEDLADRRGIRCPRRRAGELLTSRSNGSAVAMRCGHRSPGARYVSR